MPVNNSEPAGVPPASTLPFLSAISRSVFLGEEQASSLHPPDRSHSHRVPGRLDLLEVENVIRAFRQWTIHMGNHPLEVFHRPLLNQFDLLLVIGADQQGINIHVLGELGEELISKSGENVDYSAWHVRTI